MVILFFASTNLLQFTILKIEIAHDTLAKKVYAKADANDKARLRVANVIATNFLVYQENNKLLSREDLAYIRQFEDEIVLSDAEQKFIDDSKRRVWYWTIASIIGIAIIIVTLLVFSGSTFRAKEKLRATNTMLTGTNRNLLEAKDSIEQLLNNEYELKERVRKQDNLINKSNAELKEMARELEVLVLELEDKNEELKDAYSKIKGEKEQLDKDKTKLAGALQNKIVENTLAEKKLSNSQKSLKLSREAHLLLNNNNGSPTEAQIKKSFQLARAAWDMLPENSQAMDVLNEIKIKKLQQKTGGFLEREEPKYTYTQSKIKQIVTQLDSKYGKLSASELKRYYE